MGDKDRLWFAFSRYYIAKVRLAAAALRRKRQPNESADFPYQ